MTRLSLYTILLSSLNSTPDILRRTFQSLNGSPAHQLFSYLNVRYDDDEITEVGPSRLARPIERLRKYQVSAYRELRQRLADGSTNVLLHMPPGSGTLRTVAHLRTDTRCWRTTGPSVSQGSSEIGQRSLSRTFASNGLADQRHRTARSIERSRGELNELEIGQDGSGAGCRWGVRWRTQRACIYPLGSAGISDVS